MKTMMKIAALGLLGIAASGCTGYPIGVLYTGTTTPHPSTWTQIAGEGKTGAKSGEACASGILGLVAWGDASTDAAKKAAGVTDVHSAEFRSFNVLGIYTEGCTEVHGK